MPSSCCVVFGCSNLGGHEFPSDSSLRKTWYSHLRREMSLLAIWLRIDSENRWVSAVHVSNCYCLLVITWADYHVLLDYIAGLAYKILRIALRSLVAPLPNVLWRDQFELELDKREGSLVEAYTNPRLNKNLSILDFKHYRITCNNIFI